MEIVTGFVAEKVLEELLKSVREAMKKKKRLETTLKSMESTLNSIIPVLESIKELAGKSDREDEDMGRLWKQIKEGQELVRKCSKGNCFSACFKPSDCAEELRDFDNSLKRFYDFILPLKGTKILMDTRENVNEIMHTAKNIDERVGITGDEVKEIKDMAKNMNEKVEVTSNEAKGIHKAVSYIKDKANAIDEMVDATRFDVKNIKDKAKGIDEVVRVTSDDVRVISQAVIDIKNKASRVDEMVGDIHKEIQCLKIPATFPLYLPPEPPAIIVGLDKQLRDLKKELLNNKLSVIVITAPGGSGKTTLAKKLCHEDDIKGKFKDNIFFVTVSKKPNLKVIVQNLFLRKGLPHAPEFQSDDDAVNHLEQLLKLTRPHPILLVLDDVWPESESLIDKLKFQIPDYKILVTSTCVFPRFPSTCRLNRLNEVDAKDLFTSSAILPDQSSYNPDKSILDKIVEACKGNPLALTVVGRSFLEVLDNNVKVKECYMDLISFPEGHWIPATALIDMWVELRDLDESGVDSVARLHDLDALSLVNYDGGRKDASEIDGYYNDHCVMQHDLLRQHVIDQISSVPVEQRERLIIDITGNKIPNWWGEQINQHTSAYLLSITTDETFVLDWPNLQVPEVEVLILNIRTKNYVLPAFVKKMDKLKAILITNYGFVPAEVSNFPLLCSLLNLKRIRLEKVSVPSLSLCSLELGKVQKISLVMCNIGQAFSNFRIQISSSFSNLLEISIDRCIDLKNLPNWFCDLVHLKKLSISSCWELSELPTEIGKLENLELLRLHFCIELAELPEGIEKLSKLSVLDISDCSNIRHLPEKIGGLHNLRKLFMNGCSISELPSSVVSLKRLETVMCDEEVTILWKSFAQRLPILRIRGQIP
ncbi:PLANT BROAD-SPECTRUM MILDEW RESISTANCE PROTEIN RPW8 [Salix koriyanagi]|uniref:PLANT BROAD-SPECTRUM MILDEW RESISTANCE PROTEIN RPW8 n=1 Tax=Salix koriyanagi TaxID=2511006 RepID=A0A9Q0UMU6_9ROSI|nr:PLANT BROAD-SPECTRUM MILDEW RESISTANCE PROTEIN RPW8 [Salix koriyanagi]